MGSEYVSTVSIVGSPSISISIFPIASCRAKVPLYKYLTSELNTGTTRAAWRSSANGPANPFGLQSKYFYAVTKAILIIPTNHNGSIDCEGDLCEHLISRFRRFVTDWATQIGRVSLLETCVRRCSPTYTIHSPWSKAFRTISS